MTCSSREAAHGRRRVPRPHRPRAVSAHAGRANLPRRESCKSNGRDVVIPGLPLIFEQQARRGLEPGDPSGDQLLAAVRIYHPISDRGAVLRTARRWSPLTSCSTSGARRSSRAEPEASTGNE